MRESRILTYKCPRSFGTITSGTRSGSGNSLITPTGNWFKSIHFRTCSNSKGSRSSGHLRKVSQVPTKKTFHKDKARLRIRVENVKHAPCWRSQRLPHCWWPADDYSVNGISSKKLSLIIQRLSKISPWIGQVPCIAGQAKCRFLSCE